MPNPTLEAHVARRDELQKNLDGLLEQVGQRPEEERGFTDEESAQAEEWLAERKRLKRDIKTLKAIDDRAKNADRAQEEQGEETRSEDEHPVYVRSEPMTYDKDGRNSYFRDMTYLALADKGYVAEGRAAMERMQRHAHEIGIETRGMSKKERRDFDRSIEQFGGSFETRVNPNTTAGTGGEFVPPLWLVSQYIPFVRFDRVVANRVNTQSLPPGIDIINVPKITTGTLTAIQTANAAPVTSQDFVTTSVSAKVNTIAGQEDVSFQLLEQSPIAMDGVIWDDLQRDYARTLDQQVLFGTGSNGQHQGVLTQSATGSNTSITSASSINCSNTAFFNVSGSQFSSIVNGAVQIETLRIAPPTAIWAHPRRVANWSVQSDNTASLGRPYFIPNRQGLYNVLGLAESSPVEQGVAGDLYGLPVIKDGNIPTNNSSSAVGGLAAASVGTSDVVAVVKEDDFILWEGTQRLRVLPEILSGTIQCRFQVYAYSAFMPNRFAPSTSILLGAGLAAPTF